MKAHSSHQRSSDSDSCDGMWIVALMGLALLASAFSQVGCISAKGFSYGYNEESDSSGGAIRTSRLTTNARPGVELSVADKPLGEVFSTLSKKTGVPVLLGLGVEPPLRISGVFTGENWDAILRDVAGRNGFAVEAKRYESGKREAYLVSKKG